MTADRSGAASAGAVRLLVSGSARLFVDAVRRVACERGYVACGLASGPRPSVVVLIEPVLSNASRWESFGAPVVVLARGEVGPSELLDLVAAGAEAILPIDCPSDALFAAVDAVAAGRSGFDDAQVRMLTAGVRTLAAAASPSPVELTSREREILTTIDEGLSVKQAAIALTISPRTVENTRRVLYRKLSVKNGSQAIARAHELGLLAEAPRD